MGRHPLHRRNFLLHLQTRPGYDQPVLLKEAVHQPPTRSHLDQLHNEYAVTRQLADVPGVRLALAKEGTESQPVLLLEYIQGQSLAELVQSASLDLPEKLRIAVEVAGILSRIHAQQVMHKDINSINILIAQDGVSRDRGGVYIIDFGLASTMRQESPSRLTADDGLAGTLAYISPEQTGRINRPVDYRTDLYSLGVTLYELFTGQLPFQSDDALGMIHSHIARPPTPPAEISQDVPLPVSDIILKLLAKNAEDRYQTAHGLQADLGHCLDQYQAAGQIQPFALGREDFSGRLQIPAKLYGREAEIGQLVEIFERAAGGGAELLLVTGYAGVGKTSLVHELQRPVTEKRGYFIEGKFDQYQRNIPYSAWVQAFAALVELWLTESQTSIEVWKAIILEAVGQNGQVLIDLFPNLEQIIGPQPAVPELGGVEAQNRFNYLFRRFISAAARPDHPLVVFLDDLQWIDPASLNLFDVLLGDPDCEQVLVIGAYRDNEVDAGHPLMGELRRLKDIEIPFSRLTLDNLSLEQVNALVGGSLRTSPDRCLPLAQLIHAKTGGNAFFTGQLLQTLADDGLLSFDSKTFHWHWDISRLNDLTITENVVELMVDRIQRLPATSQEMLQVAACLGTRFDLALLHRVSERSQEETRLAVQAAFEEGFILQVNGSGRFAHDRIQQAAYSLINEREKPRLHRHIGQMLLAETPVQAEDEQLFDMVGHLNMAAALIEGADERLKLAELNSKASEAALRATAFATALSHAQTAIHLLGDDGWGTHYRLMLRLHLLGAEAANLNADYDLCEQHIDTILSSARSEVDKASAHVIRIESYNTQHQLQAAVETGLSALQELGVPLQEAPPSGLTLEVLRDLPLMSDRRGLAATQILAACIHPVYVSRPELLGAIVLTTLHLSIRHGLTPAGCLAIVSYASVHVWRDDIEAAYQLGRLGLELIERFDDKRYLCQINTIFDAFLLPWKAHLTEVKSHVQGTIQIGFETGNKSYLGTSLLTDTTLNAIVGKPLSRAQNAMEGNVRQLERVRERYRSYNAYLWTQYVAHLRGTAEEPTAFTGPYFVEEIDLPAAKADNIHNTILAFHSLKSSLHYHLGDYRAAYAHSRRAEPQAFAAASGIIQHVLSFYQSLALLQLPERQAAHVKKLDENVDKLRLWAEHAPMNYQHKLDMVLAERERVAGNIGAAIGHYERAIAGAKQHKFTQDEALANELYGRFWHERGNDRIAQLYLREAHALYRRWGAGAITAHLEAQYPHWLRPDAVDVDQKADVEVSVSSIHPGLDLRSVLKTAEAIAGELDLEKLLGTVMSIIMENAGAQRACLIAERDGQWIIEAEADMDTDEVRVLQGINILDSDQVSPGILHYVAHTQQVVLLGDAAAAGQFVQDPSVRQRQVKSVLSVPLINRGQLSGILYLENNLATDVFTPERAELLKLLSSQMAVSIDNARLHDHLEDEVEERTQALSFAEEQIRSLFETSQVGISLTTVEGRVLAANQALQRMTGYSEGELLQRNVIEFYVDPEQRHEMLKALTASRAVNNFGVRFKRKDDTPFYANLSVSSIIREGQEVILALIDDVTEQVQLQEHLQEEVAERKQAEQELQTQITLVDGLLDAAAETVEIWDANTLEYIKWNKTFSEVTGYSDDEIAAMKPVADFFDEADLARAEAAYAKLLQEGQATAKLTQINKDGSRIPLEYTGAVTRDNEGNPKQVIVIGRDITERLQSEEQLRFQSELLDAVEQAVVVTDLGGHVVYWNPFAEKLYGWSADEAMGRVTNELMMNDGVNQQLDTELTALLRSGKSWSGEYPAFHRDGTPLSVHSTITPITNEAGDPILAIGVSTDITERKQAELGLQQSNKSLNQRLEELSTLNLIAQTVSTVVDLPAALDIVAASVTHMFDAAGASIGLLNRNQPGIELLASFDRHFPVSSLVGKSETGHDPAHSLPRGRVFPIQDSSLVQELLVEGQSLVIPDAQGDARLASAHNILQARQVWCLMLVPLLSQGKVIGVMGISSDQPGREFTPDEVLLAETIAGQIAGAIETARLFQQAQQGAAAEERNRLAQDLHDSVTQGLYSASLIAETLPVIWEEDPDEGRRGLKQLHRFNQGALAEMRALLLELRPTALVDQELPVLLRQLEDAMKSRTRTVVTTTVVGDCSVPTEVKIALYRIAQEALNNVVKHAGARQARVNLHGDGAQISLRISDDGCGFDPEHTQSHGTPSHGMGYAIMHDRARDIDATLSITSQPDQGTQVLVEWRRNYE